ncbi:MAG: glycosyltransferase family 2 protein [Anaerolineales bacterium]|nr:glycosyltransferase family 2 protein [Anaerolineales bacterium]
MSQPELSIIVPAFNEEDLIAGTLDAIQNFLRGRNESFELILVDDGSRDNTVRLAEEWGRATASPLRALVNEKNMGKGFSVRRGVQESRGKFLIFIDADLPYELEAIDGFLQALNNGADLAIGSRVLPGSEVKGVPAMRFFAGQVFSWMVQAFLFLGIRDTQCGFKSFRAEAARVIFRRLTIGGFGFDVELLYIARKLKYRIQPVAVRMMHHRLGSRVRLLNHSLEMMNDLFAIRSNDLRGKYR